MNLQSVQEKLNGEFETSNRRLIFWYDDNGDFLEDIENIELKKAKIHRLTEDNVLYTKYLLEYEDKETSYLIYAPFSRPEDRENHLIDMILYSKQFFADKMSSLCEDLNIPEKWRNHLGKYSKFFGSKERTEKFVFLQIENYNQESIDIGILAVLCGVKSLNFEEILKNIIMDDDLENKYMISIKKMGMIESFWNLCDKCLGYREEKPCLENLIKTLLITYTDNDYRGELPERYRRYISYKKNDATIFVSNLMNSSERRKRFDNILDSFEKKLEIDKYLCKVPIENLFLCDTFNVFDEQMIEYISKKLESEVKPLDDKLREIIEKRSRKMHYADKWYLYYNALHMADKLIEKQNEFEPSTYKTAQEMMMCYAKSWSNIDKYYRLFYRNYDRVSDNESLYELRELIEQVYTNGYLAKLSLNWAEKLDTVDSYGQLGELRQEDFYKKVLSSYLKKDCTVVIISDALRYECALEIDEKLESIPGVSSELEYMTSVLPSYTKYGMASLLPHKTIEFTKDYDVLVDGKTNASSYDRERILQFYDENSKVVSYSDVMSMNRESIKSLVTGVNLIYIYHNQIDARGHHSSVDPDVFTASSETIDEMIAIVQKLKSNRTIKNFIITADHGFLYKRDDLEESDKINIKKQSDIMINRRFIMSREKLEIEGTITYSLDYLSPSCKDIYVTIPRGNSVFKASGGQKYVHGGASLQEIMIPLIKIKSMRNKKAIEKVHIDVMGLTRKITSLTVFLDFIQTENVGETLKSTKFKVWFQTDLGEKISNEEIIIADKKNETPEKRQFREKFTFRDRKYDVNEKYYLIIYDMESGEEVERQQFTIDNVKSI